MKKLVPTLLIALSLTVALFLGACGGSTPANNTNVSKPTPLPTSTATVAANTADHSKIEDALKKAGYTDVTVSIDATSGQATLRGTVAKGKMQDMVKAATEAAAKPVKNEVTEK